MRQVFYLCVLARASFYHESQKPSSFGLGLTLHDFAIQGDRLFGQSPKEARSRDEKSRIRPSSIPLSYCRIAIVKGIVKDEGI